MDKRVDEKKLDFINEAEKREAKKDICSGLVKIGDRYYEFEETEFFEEKLKMYMPKDFEDNVGVTLTSPKGINLNAGGKIVIKNGISRETYSSYAEGGD